MKARVCVDARLISQTGIGTFLQSVLHRIYANYELIILCHENEKKMLKDLAFQVIVMKNRIYTLKEQIEYFKKIPPCDLFWASHFNVPLLPIRSKKRITCIYDVYHLAHFSTLTLTQKLYAQIFYNVAFFISDVVITISEFSRKEILKHAFIPPKKLKIVNPPFDFAPTASLRNKQNFLLFVGNVKPHKNLMRLVKAYSKLQPKQPLYIVGKKEGLQTIDTLIFREVNKNPFLKKNVHFTGYVTEEKLKEFYSEACLLVFPSTYEGFGYPPLEAMASGCPVVASYIPIILEVCEDAVEYINPFSIDSIAHGINRLLNDEKRRQELIQKGKDLVHKKKMQKNQIMEVIDACCNSA